MTQPIVFIDGKKIYLRPILESDDKVEYLRWLNNPRINRYSNRLLWPTDEDGLNRYLEKDCAQKELLLAVIEKKTHRHVGNILLSAINWTARKAELSVMIGAESAQRKGFAQEAWFLMTRHAFKNLNLHRLEAGTIHPALDAILKAQKWTMEGTLRQGMHIAGEYVDVRRYGILREEFINANKD